eukprot:2553906-Rhodomonas_salina.5
MKVMPTMEWARAGVRRVQGRAEQLLHHDQGPNVQDLPRWIQDQQASFLFLLLPCAPPVLNPNLSLDPDLTCYRAPKCVDCKQPVPPGESYYPAANGRYLPATLPSVGRLDVLGDSSAAGVWR